MTDTETKSSFEAITSQEALDKIIEKHLSRERDKYSDYDALKKKIPGAEAGLFPPLPALLLTGAKIKAGKDNTKQGK
ncbi:MAG: hypothetical protein Q4A71_03070 [Actinomycetaceae bacterium]|nr:hypothetical protein [Actinomycetaceae bacterium]